MLEKRVQEKRRTKNKGPIIYWMSREQRVINNWSLLFSQKLAKQNDEKLIVIFNLVPKFIEATKRQYYFLLKGLEEVEKNLEDYNIEFKLLVGDPIEEISNFFNKISASTIVTDFDPLKIKLKWQEEIIKNLDCNFYIVDSHNIVPTIVASNKQEFGARTIRPKIHSKLNEYLINFEKLEKQNIEIKNNNYWDNTYKSLKINFNVDETDFIPGEIAARKELNYFINNKLDKYSELKNDPNFNVLSNMSFYLHFGHISSHEIALEIQKSVNPNIDVYLEELIIRKELSDNFCYYNKDYDSFDGFPNWAKKTLIDHEKDIRPIIYSLEEFENSKTDDPLWNSAQTQMVKTGKMHGFMRMYWAKKILEWSKNAKIALKIANYLNDKYSLDGRDPNGYVGTAWSIGGVHDRAWFEREIFGKIRYMNYNGCKRKFNVDKYILNN